MSAGRNVHCQFIIHSLACIEILKDVSEHVFFAAKLSIRQKSLIVTPLRGDGIVALVTTAWDDPITFHKGQHEELRHILCILKAIGWICVRGLFARASDCTYVHDVYIQQALSVLQRASVLTYKHTVVG